MDLALVKRILKTITDINPEDRVKSKK